MEYSTLGEGLFREQNSQLAQVVDALPLLIGYVDANQTYRFANRCHETWFSVPTAAIEGKHISEIIGLDEYQVILPHIEAVLVGKSADFEMQMHHRGTGPIVVKCSYVPDEGEGGQIKGFSLVVEDITKLKHQAETAIYAKNAFLTTISHEIRTPLNGILGMTELLLNTDLNDRQLKYANTVCRSGEGLLNIISDILDFCKIEAGELDIESSFFNIRDVAQGLVNAMAQKAAEKGNTIKLHFAAGTPSNVVGDSVHVRQILNNFISNSNKFTSNGNIDVSVKNQGRNEKGVKFLIEVKDTGIGISKEKVGHIFDKFSQVDGSNTRKFGGTGLGLAICQRMVKLMGGQIGVESEEGKGSNFWFSVCLPAEEVTLTTLGSGDGAVTVTGGFIGGSVHKDWEIFTGVHILLVEDDELNQQMAASMLEAMKCRVSIASNGMEAIRLMGQEKTFDIILMDCEMPEMNGYEATKIIKQTSNIPIIALTASAMRGDKDRCYEAGMDDYLPKPVNHTELEKRLLKWLPEEKLVKAG